MERREKGIRTIIILSAIVITALFLWRSYSVRPLILYHVETTVSAAVRNEAPAEAASEPSASPQLVEVPVVAEEESGEREVLVEKSVNINTAEAEKLQKLPGIGPALAGRIIEYREENNGFYDIEELMMVEGIGEKTFQKLQDFVIAE